MQEHLTYNIHNICTSSIVYKDLYNFSTFADDGMK